MGFEHFLVLNKYRMTKFPNTKNINEMWAQTHDPVIEMPPLQSLAYERQGMSAVFIKIQIY